MANMIKRNIRGRVKNAVTGIQYCGAASSRLGLKEKRRRSSENTRAVLK